MRNQKRKRNAPVAQLIRNYVNKKSGKVSVSRDELRRRFDWLDWKDQKKILAAFLDASPSDREWAYARLLDYWDESFEPQVKELWETYHEERCAWSVIRFFPLDYLKEHFDEFTAERDYYFLCLRLAMNEDFVIDRSRLSKSDYLSVLYRTNRSVTGEEALDLLFQVVHDCCHDDSYLTRLERVGEGKYRNVITPINFREVNLAFYYVVKLQQYEAAAQFKNWNEEVEEIIHNSPEFKAIDRNTIDSDFEYERRRIEIAKLYALQTLDEKYKRPLDPTFEKMHENYVKGIEYAQICREQFDKALMVSLSEFLDTTSDNEEPLPF